MADEGFLFRIIENYNGRFEVWLRASQRDPDCYLGTYGDEQAARLVVHRFITPTEQRCIYRGNGSDVL